MNSATKVEFFKEKSKFDDDYFVDYISSFIIEHLSDLPKLIADAYNWADKELSGRRPPGVRRNSRPVRVNERIAELCELHFGANFNEVSYGRFMLHFAGMCQIHILKTRKRKLPPRTTRLAIDQTKQLNLPFSDCPLVYIGHEEQNGKVGLTLLFYREGVCRRSVSFSEISTYQQIIPIKNNGVEPNESEVFARPKRKH